MQCSLCPQEGASASSESRLSTGITRLSGAKAVRRRPDLSPKDTEEFMMQSHPYILTEGRERLQIFKMKRIQCSTNGGLRGEMLSHEAGLVHVMLIFRIDITPE